MSSNQNVQNEKAATGPSNAANQSTIAPNPFARKPGTISYASVLVLKKTWKDNTEYSDFLQWKFRSIVPVSWDEGDATEPKIFADAVRAFQVSDRRLPGWRSVQSADPDRPSNSL